MRTLDLKKQFKSLYQPSVKRVEIVQVPCLQFAMIDGAIEKGYGPGNSPGFQEAVQALYSISYTLKFMLKKRKLDPIDYPVRALEGLLWLTEGVVFDINIKDNWSYTLVIMQPEVITPEIFEEGRSQVRQKRGESEALSKLRLEFFEEGLCAQIMHIGPYATEPATMARMQEFLKENGYQDCVGLGGKHHEIYLGDPRRSDPAKLKTVLRHPIEKI
jgi:hypothetical protein